MVCAGPALAGTDGRHNVAYKTSFTQAYKQAWQRNNISMVACLAMLTFACQIKFKESLLRYNTACYSESRYEECWSNKSPSPQLDVQSANRSGRVAEG